VTEDVVLNEAIISEFKQGLRSVDLFQLPESVAFDEILMADLFLSEGRINMKIRPFKHFRYVFATIWHALLMNRARYTLHALACNQTADKP